MGIENLGLYNIKIDFSKMTTYINTNIYYKESDTNTAKIKARLVMNGAVIDLTNIFASIKIITASQSTIDDSVIISDAVNGIIEYTFPVNALVEGVNYFEIILSENEMIKRSPKMAYRVLDSIEDSGIEVESNYPILLTLISNTNVVINNGNQAIVNMEDKIIEVEERTVAKETLIDNKIIETNQVIETTILAKDGTILATNNANTKIAETETTRQSIITTMSSIQTQFNALAPANSTNAEVQLARTDVTGKTYASLHERLLADNKQQNILYASVEGNYISSDSVDGYAKNVVIEGNTYQNPSTLAIKSTGTKLADGRFEIPLLSVGKNLCNDTDMKVTLANATQYDGRDVSVKFNSDTFSFGIFDSSLSKLIKASIALRFKDKDKVTLGYFASSETGSILKFSNKSIDYTKVRYVQLFCTTSVTTTILGGVCITDGQQLVSTYEQYQGHQITILSDVQIEKVGTVADRIVQASDGTWGIDKLNTRNILDKSLTVVLRTDRDLPNNALFEITLPNLKVVSYSNTVLTCNLVPSNTECLANDVEGVYQVASTNKVLLRISKAKASTVDGLKDYFINNNGFILSNQQTPTFIPLADAQQIALRTFNNKTNILSLCEIEPTIKSDVPKSTSASVNAITSQVSEISKDLERVKKLEDATNSTVITDKDFVNIEDTANGYLSDVKLEGRTLVNKKTSVFVGYLDIAVEPKKISYNSTTKTTVAKVEIGKEYTIVKKPSNRFVIGFAPNSEMNTPISNVVNPTYDANVTVTYKIKATDSTMLIYTNNESKDVDVLILEGDYTQNPPQYFEGLKSVGQDVNKIVVSSIGENLYDESSVLYNTGINFPSGELATTTDWCTSPSYIRIIKGNTYYINRGASSSIASTSQGYIYAYQYSTSKSFVARLDVGTTNNSFVATVDGYVRLAMKYNNLKSFALTTKVLPYKEYQTDKKEILYLDTVDSTWKKPVFRGIWNNGTMTVGDIAEKKSDGKYSYRKRMVEVVLNGSENWKLVTSASGVVRINLTSITSNSRLGISDKFQLDKSSDYTNLNNECISFHPTTFDLNIFISTTKATDLATAKAWLASNNVTVVYQLATELVYECTPIDVASYDSETNYTLECGVLSPRSTIKVQNFIGNIINTMKEKISLQEKENQFIYATMFEHETRLALLEGGMI